MSKFRPILVIIRAALLLFVAAGFAVAGSSLGLSAGTDYAFTADSPTFDFDGSFTIDVRFQTYSAHDGCLIAKFHQSSGQADDDSYYISVRSDGGLDARIQTMTSLITLTAIGNVHDSQWHHAALVYDIDAEIAELYLDGELGDSSPLSGPLRNTAEAVRLGTLRTTSSLADFYNGRMDELRIWNIARRGKQVSCLNDVTLLSDTPGLVSYYRFDEGAGATCYDLVAPYENFTLISGAVFSPNEPAFLSLLSGPGACFCGEISGSFTDQDPIMMLVGDTVSVPAGDSLVLSSNTLILDSTVTRFNVYGKLTVSGNAADSSYILGQYMNSSDAVIHLLAPDSVTASLYYARVSGLSSRPIIVDSPVSIVHSAFVDNFGGALLINSDANLDSSVFVNSDSISILAESGVIKIENCSFSDNSGALAISEPCSVTVKQSIFDHNVKSEGNGGAIFGSGDFDGTSGSYLALSDCQFTDNSAINGGAVWCENMNLHIMGSLFTGNSADTGGAVSAAAGSGHVCRVVIDSTDFTGNSGENGSAIHLQGIPGVSPVQFSLTHAVVSGNTGADGALYGSGITEIPGYETLAERVCFYDNTGAITLLSPHDASMIELRNLTIVGNSAVAMLSDQPAIIRNCIVTDNGSASQFSGSVQLSV
ncbi:MAG: LamG domain-containing protein, partial [Candidatus Zixiibacteriota bacterium]